MFPYIAGTLEFRVYGGSNNKSDTLSR